MATTDDADRIHMDLTDREAAVVAAMRESDRATQAIFQYAVNFAPPRGGP